MEKIEISETEKLLNVTMSVLNGSQFKQCRLEHLHFEDVNLSGTKITDANLSDLEIDGAQLGGAFIHNIGLPPEGSPYFVAGARQRPLRFDDCYLGGTLITNCNLSEVSISDCNLQGMRINGILVEELLAKYNK